LCWHNKLRQLIEAFFRYLKSKSQQFDRGLIISKAIRIGGYCVKMNFSGPSLLPTFFDVFEHLSVDPESVTQPCLIMNFWDSEATGINVDEIPWKEGEQHHLGLIKSFTDHRFFTLQQPGSGAIYMLDVATNEGYYWVSSVSAVPFWEADFPLRSIFHWWLKNTMYQPIHAAAVGTEHGGVLLVGRGGSGKSTTALSCLNSDLKIVGDDYVMLDCREAIAYSLFSRTKLTRESISLLAGLPIDIGGLNAPMDNKYRIPLYPDYKSSLIRAVPIVAVLLPEVTQQNDTHIDLCKTSEAMLALSPTTLFQLPGLREESFRKMSAFIKSVPCRRLFLGKDTRTLPGTLKNFISSLPGKKQMLRDR
jgi:hypothetical protein